MIDALAHGLVDLSNGCHERLLRVLLLSGSDCFANFLYEAAYGALDVAVALTTLDVLTVALFSRRMIRHENLSKIPFGGGKLPATAGLVKEPREQPFSAEIRPTLAHPPAEWRRPPCRVQQFTSEIAPLRLACRSQCQDA